MKKKHLFRILMAAAFSCVLVCLCAAASAVTWEGTCGANVTWSFDTDSSTLTISGTGRMDDYPDEAYAEEDTLPWRYFGESIHTIVIRDGVTSIGDNAFCRTAANTVVIPDTVSSIGANPFATYTMSTVILSVHHPYLEMIGGALCTKAEKRLICYPDYHWDSVITIPDGIREIGDRAFSGFVNTEQFILPESVESIGTGAFRDCKKMASIRIPKGVTHVGGNPFYGCTSLDSIQVAPGHPYLTVVDGVLFSKPDHRLITFPNTVRVSSYEIPEGTEIIGDSAFPGSYELGSVTIPDTVTAIGNYAFRGTQEMPRIVLPDSVKTIGDYAFYFCTATTEIVIPDSVESIGDYAFLSCMNLHSVTIPDSVVSMGKNPFTNAGYGGTTVQISPDHPYLEMVDGILYSKPDRRLICLTPACGGTSVTIPDGTRIIGNNAFRNFEGEIESVTIPASVISMEAGSLPEDRGSGVVYTVYRGSYAERFCADHEKTVVVLDGPAAEAPGETEMPEETEAQEAAEEPGPGDPESWSVSAGSTIFFGQYDQDNILENGWEDLQWIILEIRGDEALLLSRYGLEYSEFHYIPNEETDWARSSLRTWLNGEFYYNAFSDAEKEAILLTNVDNSAAQGNSEWHTDGGPDTEDMVWLLSWAEAQQYFRNNDTRACGPTRHATGIAGVTAFAYARAWMYTDSWWLRSPGERQTDAAWVLPQGGLGSCYASADSVTVRPVIRVSLPALARAGQAAAGEPAPQAPETEPDAWEAPAPQQPADEPANVPGEYGRDDGGDFVVSGPVTSWDGSYPETEACAELLHDLYFHVGSWSRMTEGEVPQQLVPAEGYPLVLMNYSMTSLEYGMAAEFPGIGRITFDYVAVDPASEYIIFYTEDGETEAHLWFPNHSYIYMLVYSRNSVIDEALGSQVFIYGARSALPDAGSLPNSGAWENDWYGDNNGFMLEITHTGGEWMHLVMRYGETAVFETDFEAADYESAEIGDPSQALNAMLYINPYEGGRLEMYANDNPFMGQEELRRQFEAAAGPLTFSAAEVPPDLTWYGWIPDFGPEDWNEPVIRDPAGSAPAGSAPAPEPAATAAPAEKHEVQLPGGAHTPWSLIGNNNIIKTGFEEVYWWIPWLRTWHLEDDPETTLDFTDNGDFTLHMTMHFDPSPDAQADIKVNGIESTFFDPNYGSRVHLYLNGDSLEMFIEDIPEFAQYGKTEKYADGKLYLRFVPDEPIDPELAEYIREAYEELQMSLNWGAQEPEAGEPEGPDMPSGQPREGIVSWLYREAIFSALRNTDLQVSSGAGAWEGHLRVESSGRFTGEYYDEDFDTVYKVSFEGLFGNIHATGDGRFTMAVDMAATARSPGDEEEGEYGEHIIYQESIMPAGSEWMLTLPGTPEELIPETVKELIMGTYAGEADLSGFVTLTNTRDGWGFFAGGMKPVKLAVDDAFSETLFRENASIYNNDLAIAAAKLSWEIESESTDRLARQFDAFRIRFPFYGKFEHGTYKEWKNGAVGAFAFGKKIMSFDYAEDTTLITVVARGTQNFTEDIRDYTNDTATHQWLNERVDKDILGFEYAMWDAFIAYLSAHPITTPNVKILVTGHSLGGAMANLFGAHLTKCYRDLDQLSQVWLSKRDIYVYTFGAIRVTEQYPNKMAGYENIHNVYNHYDSFGPYGSEAWKGLGVSSPEQKFGHTEEYQADELNYAESGTSTNNHNMDNYLKALEGGYVVCSMAAGN